MLIFDKDTPLNLNEFQNNGLGFLSDFITSPLITEELNSKGLFTGIYKLEFSYSKDGKNAEFLKELNFIKVPIDSTFQIFFIESIKITLKRIDVYAKHIFFITKNGFLEDSRPTNENATTALTNILEDTQFANTFSAYSDSGVESTAYYIRKNLIEAIITGDNSILKNWNCDLELDNFTIKLLSNRGSNTNFEIEYGKNLVGIEYSVDFSDVATRIYPQGANELLIAEKYIESELIDNYPFIFIKHIVFDDVEVNEEVSQEQAELILRSKVHELYYNGIDKPKINIKINWLDLSKTKEFEEYSHFEEVKLGDIINVRFQNMLITARIIKTVYDYNQQKFIAFELGSIKADLLKNQQQIIRQEIRSTVNIESVLKKAQANATSLITNALGGFVLKTENELFIMDTDDPNTATRVWRWNLNGLGYSSDGINGNYELAMTMDGQIVANFVNAGVLEGALIKAGSVTVDKFASNVLTYGGTNLIKNSVGHSKANWENKHDGFTNTDIQNNTVSGHCFFIGNKSSNQVIQVQNGTYTIGFKYKKLLELAEVKIKVNDHEIELTETDWTTGNYTFEVLSNTITVELIGDNDNSCYVSDLMGNQGIVAHVWSSASGESINGGVKIGSSIEIESSVSNIKQIMDNDGNRIKNISTDETVAEFTDKGMNSKEIKSDKAEIARVVIQNVGNSTWLTRI
ncbi:MAG: phage tail protein [Bacilli bacterium]|nr:phage tail protein [Bacilli bacterium]